jgi:hypothetical protein
VGAAGCSPPPRPRTLPHRGGTSRARASLRRLQRRHAVGEVLAMLTHRHGERCRGRGELPRIGDGACGGVCLRWGASALDTASCRSDASAPCAGARPARLARTSTFARFSGGDTQDGFCTHLDEASRGLARSPHARSVRWPVGACPSRPRARRWSLIPTSGRERPSTATRSTASRTASRRRRSPRAMTPCARPKRSSGNERRRCHRQTRRRVLSGARSSARSARPASRLLCVHSARSVSASAPSRSAGRSGQASTPSS